MVAPVVAHGYVWLWALYRHAANQDYHCGLTTGPCSPHTLHRHIDQRSNISSDLRFISCSTCMPVSVSAITVFVMSVGVSVLVGQSHVLQAIVLGSHLGVWWVG